MDELQRFRLDDRVAIVAGGSGGIGLRTCAALAAVGARSPSSVAPRSGSPTPARPRSHAGAEARVVAGDMAQKAAADDAVAADARAASVASTSWSTASAGVPGPHSTPPRTYPQAGLGADRRPEPDHSAAGSRRPRPAAMIAGGHGGPSSTSAQCAASSASTPGYSAYVAAKGALDALTRQHATEWAKHSIRVNTISPTFVRTEQAAELLAAPGVLRQPGQPHPAAPDRRDRRPRGRPPLLLLPTPRPS